MIDLYSSLAESGGQAKANQLVLFAIHNIFLNTATITNNGLDSDHMKKVMFESGILGEILFGDCREYNNESWQEIISQSFAYARDNGINLMDNPTFKVWIVENSNRLNQDIESGRYTNYWERAPIDYIAMIEAGFISGNSDPEKICKRYTSIKRSYRNQFDIELIRSIASRKPEALIRMVEDSDFTKNVTYPFRSIIYATLASFGKLSKKAARKIRSDSSEEASEAGIREIAKNLHKFENATEVLSQVMDTKHFSSARYLADTVPKQYLPFMAVCQDQRVREIVVNRMHGVSDV